jgi:hypothetical protein
MLAQNSPKSISLTAHSNVPAKDLSKALRNEDCSSISIVSDAAKSDYTLEAIDSLHASPYPYQSGEINRVYTLFSRDGKTVRSSSSMKDVCHAIQRGVIVEVVDTQNMTQSIDARGTGNPATIAGAVTNATGRRTLTDAATIAVIVNGEHALLDCFERRKGCITVGPGKYYGELDFASAHGVGGIWIEFEVPLTHQQVRDHYKIAGSW